MSVVGILCLILFLVVATPLLVVIFSLLALFIKLLKDNPKIAVILIFIPLVLFISFVLQKFVSFPIKRHVSEIVIPQIRPNGPGSQISIRQWNDNPGIDDFTVYPISSGSSPIWSEGIEEQFEADVYPSKTAALYSIGRRIVKLFPDIIEDYGYQPQEIIVFPNSQEMQLVEELRAIITKLYPDIVCRIKSDEVISQQAVTNKIGIFFYVEGKTINGYSANPKSGIIKANILAYQEEPVVEEADFIEKPWVEKFSSFVNSQPAKRYRVAISNETCLTHAEANQQAMENACSLIVPLVNNSRITYEDLIASKIVSDKFVQSFELSTGKVWREAILLDISGGRLNLLINILSKNSRDRSKDWAKTVLSVLGLFVLITIVYVFLNAATRGYYTWSLRIAGVILAAIFFIIILRIVN